MTEYVYDTEGRRVIRIDDAAGTPTVTYYIGGYEIEDPGGTETEYGIEHDWDCPIFV